MGIYLKGGENMDYDTIAYDTASNWANNCFDDDFYDCCVQDLIDNGYSDEEVDTIWNIIEEKYLDL